MADANTSAIFYVRPTMLLESIQVTDFRNIATLQTDFSPGINVFYGNNGSGKTNLLEAVFTLLLTRSQRGAADTVLVRNDCDVYRLEGSVKTRHETLNLSVAYQRGTRKKITIERVAVRPAELYERFCAVASGPEDSDTISGPPSKRRLFLDIYLSQLSKRYLSDLTDYQKTLAQRNAALKHEMDPSAFDELLVTLGSNLMQARLELLRGLAVSAGGYYSDISGGETFRVEYEPKVALEAGVTSLGDIRELFERQLDKARMKEQVMKTSLVGPHRDEVAFTVGGLPARTHGSQGQWRTAAVSLKLAVYQELKARRNVTPVLLLDEIFAELDSDRSRQLLELFSGTEQLFLTTAAEPSIDLNGGARKFRIADGSIEDVA